jgi:myo-inositol 2-dehydrogenase / D-chiro-inositol 1-dehydrogenase
MTQKVNVGIIGAGRIGKFHAETLSYRVPEANIVAIADIFEDVAKKVGAELGIPNVYVDPRRIIDDKSIEAVVICSSTDTHSKFIEEAAAAGKHIFCEKPIDFDLKRIDHALAAVDKAGVKLQIGFNRRFDPSFKRIHDTVAAGTIGLPHLLRITSRDPQPPPIAYVKVSGGIFLDMTIHDFDMARYLMGEEVDEIYAAGGVLVDPAIGAVGDIDTAIVTLHFRSGAIGTIDNSRQAVYGYDQRAEVFGSKGCIMAGNNKPDSTELSTSQNVSTSLPLFFFMQRYTEAYVTEMKDFIAAITENKPIAVTGQDGRRPVVMGQAAKKSYEEHRPVKLTEIDPTWK